MEKYLYFKKKIYYILNPYDEKSSKYRKNILNRVFEISMIILIVVNTIIIISETFKGISGGMREIFFIVETFSIIIFTIEYILNVWVCDLKDSDSNSKSKRKSKPHNAVTVRLKYVFSLMAIIDLVAILPFYLPFVLPFNLTILKVLRLLRLLRLIRLFKFSKYINELDIIFKVIKNEASKLISVIIFIFVLMIISAVIMYDIEYEAQPEVFQNAFHSGWWVIETLTTIGYGDIYPVTVAGRILGALFSLFGFGFVVLPSSIITAGYIREYEKGHKNINAAGREDYKDDKDNSGFKGKVILICGKIASGKTTYAKDLIKDNKAVLLSADEITLALFDSEIGEKHDENVERTEKYLFEKAVEIIKTGTDVILDWGFWTREERLTASKFFKNKNIEYEWHYIDVSDEVLRENLKKRNSDIENGKNLFYYFDDDGAEHFWNMFEIPSLDEIDVLYKNK